MTAPHLIVIDPDHLAQIVRDAVRDAMDARPQEEWLTVKEYAARLGRSEPTVRRYIKAGEVETRDVCGVTQVRA